VALGAGDLRAGEVELVAQGLGERLADLGVDVVRVAVDDELSQP
jgi:hypothetical protein